MQLIRSKLEGLQSPATAVMACWLLLTPTVVVFAQSPSERDDDILLEEITVTGTRIKRPNIESASPVTVVGADEISNQGANTLESVMNRLPQFTADANENVSNGSDGTARLNLRNTGAGFNNTKNGRKAWVPYKLNSCPVWGLTIAEVCSVPVVDSPRLSGAKVCV